MPATSTLHTFICLHREIQHSNCCFKHSLECTTIQWYSFVQLSHPEPVNKQCCVMLFLIIYIHTNMCKENIASYSRKTYMVEHLVQDSYDLAKSVYSTMRYRHRVGLNTERLGHEDYHLRKRDSDSNAQ